MARAAPRISLLALWICFGIYVIVLFATAMAGPSIALWLWSLLAAPQFWEGAQRIPDRHGRPRPSWGAVTIAVLWLAMVGVLPLLGLLFGWRAEVPSALVAPLAVVVLGLPLVVTVALTYWERGRRRMTAIH